MATYNRAIFSAAHAKYFEAPTTLTDDELAQFAIVDPAFAERARAKRAGFVEAVNPEFQKAGELGAVMHEFVSWVADVHNPILATYRHRLDELEQRNRELETRLLTMEAQRALTP